MSRMSPPCPKTGWHMPPGAAPPAGAHPARASGGDLGSTAAQPPLSEALWEGGCPGGRYEEGVVLGTALLCCVSTRGCEQPSNGSRHGAGRCRTQTRCSRRDAGSMATLGKGSYHHLAAQKLLPFAPLKGTQWTEGRRHAAPGPPDAGGGWRGELGGIMAQPHGCHLHTAQPPTMSPSPCTACMVKRLHAQAPCGPTLSLSASPLSKMTSTLVPRPLTPHTDHLLWHHHPCRSRVMLCSLCTSQQEP